MRIDAHHHIWSLERHPQTWMTAEEDKIIGRDFSAQDWAAAAATTPITHSIVVQTVEDHSETLELLALTRRYPSIIGVVGWVEIDRGDATEQLDILLDRPDSAALVSIRDLTQYRDNFDWLASDAALNAFEAAGKRGLTIDLLITPANIPAAVRAVAANPDTRFVVNHLAKPNLDTLGADEWGASIAGLADAGNVAIKLSGVATLTADFTSVGERLALYVEETLRRFGAERTIFGSDWPVSRLGATYEAVVESIERTVVQLSPAERERIWSGSAVEWYGLDSTRIDVARNSSE